MILAHCLPFFKGDRIKVGTEPVIIPLSDSLRIIELTAQSK